jgi:hypothetical protein
MRKCETYLFLVENCKYVVRTISGDNAKSQIFTTITAYDEHSITFDDVYCDGFDKVTFRKACIGQSGIDLAERLLEEMQQCKDSEQSGQNDGVTTSATFNDGTIYFNVASPGSNFDVIIPNATETTPGLMSKEDKDKLTGLENYTHPNHTGDVTSDSDGDTEIKENVVDNFKLADMPPNTVKVNNTDNLASPVDLPLDNEQLLGRGETGDIQPIILSDDFLMDDNVIKLKPDQGFFTSHNVKSYPVSSLDQIRTGTFDGEAMARYKGQHDRIYIVYETILGTVRKGYLTFYDFNKEQWADPIFIADAPQDVHNSFSISVDNKGHVYVAGGLEPNGINVLGGLDDGVINVFKSKYSELDNNGDLDITFDLLPTASISAYTNYGAQNWLCYKNKPRYILSWRGNAQGTSNQTSRSLAYSDDFGNTFSNNIEYLSLDANHWAYGFPRNDYHSDGLFFVIDVRIGGTGTLYPKNGIIWTPDLVNFGNLEYYASAGQSGWSKNVITQGAITDTEFVQNIAIHNEDYTSTDEKLIRDLNQMPDGSLYFVMTYRVDTVVQDYEYYYYDLPTKILSVKSVLPNSWTNEASNFINPKLIPLDKENVQVLVTDSSNNLVLGWSHDGAETFEQKSVLFANMDGNSMAWSSWAHTDREHFILAKTGDSFKLIRFGEPYLNNRTKTEVQSVAAPSNSYYDTYDIDNGIIVTGSLGITSTQSNGKWTIIVPTDGLFISARVNIEKVNAIYIGGTVTQGINITLDNSANNIQHNISGMVYGYNDPVSATNRKPLIPTLTMAQESHDNSGGISSIIFGQVPANLGSYTHAEVIIK